ncbi:hypothetical protein, partial [Enterobacter hormaechei]
LNSFASPMRLWCGSPLVVSGEFRFLGNPCPGAGHRHEGLTAHFSRTCAHLRKNPARGFFLKKSDAAADN